MSHPRPYDGAPNSATREELEAWINQIEDLSGKTIAIHVNPSSDKTVLMVDLDIPKPGPARVQMGHIAAGGGDAVMGTAYIQNQVMDVTVLH